MSGGIQEVGWIVLPTRDVPRLASWLRDVLGLSLLRGGDTYAQFAVGPRLILELVPLSKRNEEPPRRFFYRDAAVVLRVYGVETVMADLQAKGVPFISDLVDIPHGKLAFFHDPEGHVFAIQERSADSTAEEDIAARAAWEARPC